MTSLDARELAFSVLEQLPDVTNVDRDTFKVLHSSNDVVGDGSCTYCFDAVSWLPGRASGP